MGRERSEVQSIESVINSTNDLHMREERDCSGSQCCTWLSHQGRKRLWYELKIVKAIALDRGIKGL
jgi:hypothetical protein